MAQIRNVTQMKKDLMREKQCGLELLAQVGFELGTFPSWRGKEAKGEEVSWDPPK